MTITLALTLTAVLLLSASYLVWQWRTGDLMEEEEEDPNQALFDQDAYDADYAEVLEGIMEEDDDES